MAIKKTKQNIDVIIQYDVKEKDLDYLKTIKIDSRRSKTGIKVIGLERENVKPLGVTIGTGDVSFKCAFEGEKEFTQSNLCVEIKKGNDAFSSIYTKANYDRLIAEFERGLKVKLDMYYLITDSMTELNRKINTIRRFNDDSCKIYFNNFLKLQEYLQENKIPIICTGSDIGWVLRRLVMKNIEKYKLNYR